MNVANNNTREIQRTCQGAAEKGGLDLVFGKWGETLDSQRKKVRASFCRKTRVRRGIKEGKPRNEFVRVNWSICHKGRWVGMARLWPSCWVAEVPHADLTHVYACGCWRLWYNTSGKPSHSEITSESVLSLYTDEQETPLNWWTWQGQSHCSNYRTVWCLMKDCTDNREGKQECLETINRRDFFWENSHLGFWFGWASLLFWNLGFFFLFFCM